MCYTSYCRVLIFLNIKCTITVSRGIDRKIKWALILYLSHCEDKAISFCTFLPFGNRYKSRRCNDDTGGGNASQLGSSWEKLHKRHKWRKPFRKTKLEFTKKIEIWDFWKAVALTCGLKTFENFCLRLSIFWAGGTLKTFLSLNLLTLLMLEKKLWQLYKIF